jgi:hypothetical protein
LCLGLGLGLGIEEAEKGGAAFDQRDVKGNGSGRGRNPKKKGAHKEKQL